MEGKRNDVGMRFVLDPNAGEVGFLIWNEQVVPAIINWRDPVVQHGLRHSIKYVRLVRRKASSPQAQLAWIVAPRRWRSCHGRAKPI